MSTIIFPSPIFGPIHSRRLGISLGINLMPADGKLCSFDCVYCECGFNNERHPSLPRPSREQVSKALEETLLAMAAEGQRPDVLTFAGNGEPTAHPDFEQIMQDTIALRDRHCPDALVSVLSNATFIHRDNVRRALMMADNNILKLDTVDNEYIRRADRPANRHYDAARIVEEMKRFNGHVIIQTMFMKGHDAGTDMDNTSEKYVGPWLKAVEEVQPECVMIYTIDRETPCPTLEKASPEELDAIGERVKALGIKCTVSY